jgi:berberine-like enzyme
VDVKAIAADGYHREESVNRADGRLHRATAFAPREAEYDLGILSQWSDPSESSRHVSWTREFSEAMSPFTTGAYLLNFLGDEGQDTVRAAFGANYPRLAQLKAKYDPTNFFRVNQNVVPADAAAV